MPASAICHVRRLSRQLLVKGEDYKSDVRQDHLHVELKFLVPDQTEPEMGKKMIRKYKWYKGHRKR